MPTELPSVHRVLAGLATSMKYGGASPLRVVRDYEREVMASVDTFTTSEGKLKFKMDTKDFAQFLSSQGIRGGDAGKFLRGEESISEDMLKLMVRSNKTTHFGYGEGEKYKVQVLGGPRVVAPGQTRKGPLPDIQKVWDMLRESIHKETMSAGSDAGDMFVNMGREYEDEDFDQYLQGVSGDVSQSFEYALGDKSNLLYRKFVDLLRSGEYTGGSYDNWSLRYRKQILAEIYADAWYNGMIKGWEKIQRNPKELARLKAMRTR